MPQQVGKYQLIRKLATGGMAEVYLAKSSGPLGFEKLLVLKRILPRLSDEPDFVDMFLSEAKLAARLTHSHIAQIFDFGQADGAYFIAMEYIDGPSVGALIKKAVQTDQSLPPLLCARIIADACEALAFAHDFADPLTRKPLHLIHRDVSPDNLLLSRQGKVKVVDFGIAKAAGQSHQTQAGIVRGKLSYMAPEQLRGDLLDRRADVYATGVVLYELLTGRRPYDTRDTRSRSPADLMRARLEEEPVPAVTHRPDLPESLRRILDQAIALDPDLRYQDCASLQADLEEFIVEAGKPVTSQHIAQLITQLEAMPELPELSELDIPAAPAAPPVPSSPSVPKASLPKASVSKSTVPKAPVPGLVARPGVGRPAVRDDELPVLTALATSILNKRGPPVLPPPPGARSVHDEDDMTLEDDRTEKAPAVSFTQEMQAPDGTPGYPLPKATPPPSRKVRSATRSTPAASATQELPAQPKRGLRPWMLVLLVLLVLVGVELILWWATSQD